MSEDNVVGRIKRVPPKGPMILNDDQSIGTESDLIIVFCEHCYQIMLVPFEGSEDSMCRCGEQMLWYPDGRFYGKSVIDMMADIMTMLQRGYKRMESWRRCTKDGVSTEGAEYSSEGHLVHFYSIPPEVKMFSEEKED